MVACVVRMHCSAAWTTWTEVRIDNRRLDLVAESAHGYRIGYEVKSDLVSFRHEIRNVQKRGPGVLACNEFYFVLPEWYLPEARDVPFDCGLMSCDRDGTLRIIRPAPQRP